MHALDEQPRWVPYKKGELPTFKDGDYISVPWDTIEQAMEAVEELPDDQPNFSGGYQHKHRKPRADTFCDRRAYQKRLTKRRAKERNRRRQNRLKRA